MSPCKDCPFWATSRGMIGWSLVQQMQASAESLGGFPCHMKNPGNDILTCVSAEANANDCVGYRWMLENLTSPDDVHPDIVGCFDELIGS